MAEAPDPEQIGQSIIEDFKQGEDSQWDQIRIDIASQLRFNNDYKKTKLAVQGLLSSTQLKTKIRSPTTNEYEIAELIDVGGGTQTYKKALTALLSRDSEFGKELFKKVSSLVDERVREGKHTTSYGEIPSME